MIQTIKIKAQRKSSWLVALCQLTLDLELQVLNLSLPLPPQGAKSFLPLLSGCQLPAASQPLFYHAHQQLSVF